MLLVVSDVSRWKISVYLHHDFNDDNNFDNILELSNRGWLCRNENFFLVIPFFGFWKHNSLDRCEFSGISNS